MTRVAFTSLKVILLGARLGTENKYKKKYVQVVKKLPAKLSYEKKYNN